MFFVAKSFYISFLLFYVKKSFVFLIVIAVLVIVAFLKSPLLSPISKSSLSQGSFDSQQSIDSDIADLSSAVSPDSGTLSGSGDLPTESNRQQFNRELCDDSDGGFNPYNRGKVCHGDECVVDYCTGDALVEYGCGSYTRELFVCPEGCINGACKNDYVYVCTVADLNKIRENLSLNYLQVCNIDLSGQDFKPIGNSTNPFTGKYNGNYYSINNLRQVSPVNSSNSSGFFGVISEAKIIGVRLKNASVTSGISGILVGYATRSDLSNLYIEGYAEGSLVGGIVGFADGLEVRSAYFNGTVYSSNSIDIVLLTPEIGSSAGGIVGTMEVYGRNPLIIDRVDSFGNVSSIGAAGGIVGSFFRDSDGQISPPLIVKRSSFKGTVVTYCSYVAGIVSVSMASLPFVVINDSYVIADIKMINATGLTMAVCNNWWAGGFISGKAFSASTPNLRINITNSYSASRFFSINVAPPFGNISNTRVYGIAAFVNNSGFSIPSTVQNVYWDYNVSGVPSSRYDSLARSTLEMTSVPRPVNTYVNWDFTNVWSQQNGHYPALING